MLPNFPIEITSHASSIRSEGKGRLIIYRSLKSSLIVEKMRCCSPFTQRLWFEATTISISSWFSWCNFAHLSWPSSTGYIQPENSFLTTVPTNSCSHFRSVYMDIQLLQLQTFQNNHYTSYRSKKSFHFVQPNLLGPKSYSRKILASLTTHSFKLAISIPRRTKKFLPAHERRGKKKVLKPFLPACFLGLPDC